MAGSAGRRSGRLSVVLLEQAVGTSPTADEPISGTIPVGPYGHELYYETEGTGEPVVLIHGLTLDLRMWDAQMDALTSQYQVIRYDAVGHGRSSGVEGDVPNGTFRQWDHLLEVLDALKIEKAHIVGLSMGGSSAMDFAIEHPDRIQSMTSVVEGHVSLGAGAAFAWPNLQNFAALDAISRLHEIEAPSLILVGELDAPDFHIEADYLDRDIPDSAKFVVPAAGHMANMEQPAIVNAMVLDFLADHPISAVPEPSTVSMLIIGALIAVSYCRHGGSGPPVEARARSR